MVRNRLIHGSDQTEGLPCRSGPLDLSGPLEKRPGEKEGRPKERPIEKEGTAVPGHASFLEVLKCKDERGFHI